MPAEEGRDRSTRDSSERWTRLDRAFRAALEQEAPDRDRWVRAQYADQPELLAALLELLAADGPSARAFDAAGRYLDRLAGVALEAPERQAGQLVGARIGPYRLEALLATGGMGAVYRAVRDDGQFDQQVAIKILPGWATDDTTVARLKAERQILSNLQHPAITALLDGGETPDGYPYLVTEFIDGQPLDQWLVERRPTLETRLNLFLRVAEAVQSAHEAGVVHRDLKPANLLVDSEGRPHLLDFGIAKLMAEAGPSWAPRTATGFTPMTPEYASPEQLAGESVGPASDVYQLGLLLYLLLSGQRPDQRPDAPGSPTRPSVILARTREAGQGTGNVDNEPRPQALRGPLDTIVLKALRSDPGDRYPSARALGEDLRRYLRGEPVQARPETPWSAAWRLARHYPVAAALSLALIAVLAMSAVGLGLYAQALEMQRNEAQRQAARAAATRDTLLDLFRRADPLQADTIGGRAATVWDSLDAAVEQARRELSDQPDILAELLATLSGLYMNAGQHDQALALMEEAITRFRDLGPEGADGLAVHLAEYAKFLGEQDRESADPLMMEALAAVPRLAGTDPASAIAILMDAGYYAYDVGLHEQALERFDRAAQIAREAGVDDASQQVELLFSQGNALTQLGQWETAQERLEAALVLAESTFGPGHQRLAGVLSALGNLAKRKGETAQSIAYLRRTVDILESNNATSYHSLLSARNNLALALGSAGRYDEAQRGLREVVELRRRLAGPEGSRDLGLALKSLATYLHLDGDFPAALEALDESEQMLERHLPAVSPFHALPHFTRGLVRLDSGSPGLADEEFRETLDILVPTLGETHYQVHVTRCMRAEALRVQEAFPEASSLALPALEAMRLQAGEDDPYLQRCRDTVASLKPSVDQNSPGAGGTRRDPETGPVPVRRKVGRDARFERGAPPIPLRPVFASPVQAQSTRQQHDAEQNPESGVVSARPWNGIGRHIRSRSDDEDRRGQPARTVVRCHAHQGQRVPAGREVWWNSELEEHVAVGVGRGLPDQHRRGLEKGLHLAEGLEAAGQGREGIPREQWRVRDVERDQVRVRRYRAVGLGLHLGLVQHPDRLLHQQRERRKRAGRIQHLDGFFHDDDEGGQNLGVVVDDTDTLIDGDFDGLGRIHRRGRFADDQRDLVELVSPWEQAEFVESRGRVGGRGVEG